MIPGWSETPEFAWGFANEISSGQNAMVENVRAIIPVADAIKYPELLERHAKECSFWTHSAGIMAVNEALQVFSAGGPEPTTIPRLIINGAKVGLQQNNQEEAGIPIPPLSQGIIEILRHPMINASIIRKIGSFSTSKHLGNGGDKFPEGRAMFTFAHDEHEFTRLEAMLYALESGVHVDVFGGLHNAQMYRPSYVAAAIKHSLENYTV